MKTHKVMSAKSKLYRTKADAEKDAAALSRWDEDWTYRVVESGFGGYLVEVSDEDGEFVHYWGVPQ